MSNLGGSPATLDLAGLVLNQADPGTGLEAGFTSIPGWHKRAPMSVDRQRRAGHGEFATPGKLAGRILSINGWAVADDRGTVARWTEDLAALLADGSFGTLTVTDDDLGVRWASVQMIDDPTVDWDGQEWVRFQIPLLAPNPLKYGALSSGSTGFASDPEGSGLVFPLFEPNGFLDFGPVATSSGTVTITNAGTAAASPRFTVTGPTPAGGFRIVDLGTGDRITYHSVVPANSELVFDAATGTVVIDGGPSRRGDTVVTRWPVIPRRSSATYLFAPESSPTAANFTAAVYHTYN